MKRSIPGLVAILLLGCAEDASPVEETLVFDDESKADDGVVRPFATFRATEQGAPVDTLVLKEDRTFRAEGWCDDAGCVDALADDFRFATSHGNRYIVLFEEDVRLHSFQYELEGDTLRLRSTEGQTWTTLVRAEEAWCSAPVDCVLQPFGQTSSCQVFSCEANACQARCGATQENCSALEASFDDCVGLHGLHRDECILELETQSPGTIGELDACCAEDEGWLFCATHAPVDFERCLDLEAAFDDCVGTHGLSPAECVEEMSGDPGVAEDLAACCEADHGFWDYCRVD